MSDNQFQLYFLFIESDGSVFYIGITKRPLRARLASHVFDAKAKKPDGTWKHRNHRTNKLRQLIEQKTPFQIEPLLHFDNEEEAKVAEVKYIAWCKQMGWNLVNATEGGEGIRGYRHSEKTKAWLRELNSGPNNPQFGKSPAQETREKQRQALKGLPNPGLQDPEKKERWRANIKATHPDVAGSRNPMFGTTGSKNAKSKPIRQLVLNGDELGRFAGLREAERATGVPSSGISLCCQKKQQTAGGFRWEYTI
jgi:predicted GIY-YIG superfamily endonuclease